MEKERERGLEREEWGMKTVKEELEEEEGEEEREEELEEEEEEEEREGSLHSLYGRSPHQ